MYNNMEEKIKRTVCISIAAKLIHAKKEETRKTKLNSSIDKQPFIKYLKNVRMHRSEYHKSNGDNVK